MFDDLGKKHISVLLKELVLNTKIFEDRQNVIVDATLGMGGHAIEIINKLGENDIFIGFDADIRNLELAKKRIEIENKNKKVKIFFINSNFLDLKSELEKIKIKKITAIYYDLGLSSLHLDEADRGFSFKNDGPLDMRFNSKNGKNAKDIINSYKEEQLIKIFREFSEEPYSLKIAKAIIQERKKKKIETTLDLKKIIEGITSFPKAKNRIFQALRIEVNNELENLRKSLNDAIVLLIPNGSIFVISFHSLEDRIVKNILRNETKDCICRDLICSCKHKKRLKLLTKKPILPTSLEIKQNSRSRSAKARYAIKI